MLPTTLIATDDDDFLTYKRRRSIESSDMSNVKGKGKSSDVWFSSRSKLDANKKKSLSLKFFNTPTVSTPTTSTSISDINDVIEID